MAQDDEDFAAAALATGASGPFGKFTEDVKAHLDEHTYNLWLQLCAKKDVKSGELLRDLVYVVVHGKTPAELVAQDRRALLQGEGPNAALERFRRCL